MSKSTSTIRFTATLLRPADKAATWTFLKVPKEASAKLPTRSMTSVEGTINGTPLLVTLEPDGDGSHWLKVEKKLREAAGAKVGDVVKLDIEPAKKEPEPIVPPNLKKALAASPKAKALWSDITPVARRDWIHWIATAKQAETREKRVGVAISKLEAGKRRACCFDRSGMYDKSMSCPLAEGEVPKELKKASNR
jgi:hypothetical protein